MARHREPGRVQKDAGRARWSEEGGRRRRLYELTPAGLRTLDDERSAWREFSAAVTSLLGPPPRPRPVTP